MIFIGRDEEHIKLEEMERVSHHLSMPDDVQVKVNLRLQDFHGSYSHVWLYKPDLERFVEELKLLVETRRTSAKLEAMSPEEFSLELRPCDSLGHYEASVRLGRYQYSGSTYWPTMISGGFEIGSDLNHILADFKALLVPNDTR